MSDWAIVGIALVAVGVLFIVLGLPLVRGRVPRNSFYGYRTPTTRRDDRVWYPVNAMAGLWLIWAGTLATAIGVLLLLLHDRDEAARLVLWIGVPALILCIVLGIYRGWRLARAIDEHLNSTDE